MIKPENLYLPDKYRVILGEGLCSGLCTLWNEPEKAIKECPALLQKSAIIGTLYSRQGVNIILRNLALNPQIHHLYLWSHGTLSCSPFGVSGKEILLNLWSKGISDDGIIPQTDFKIEKEIDVSVVRKIIENIKLEEILDGDLNIVASKIINENKSPYMTPVSFAEAVPEVIDVFPSEKVGFLVRGRTVIETWTKVIDRIMRYGTVKGTQYGTQQRELISVTWAIENEDPEKPNLESDLPESVKNTIGLNENSINHYKSIFTSPETPEGIKYTYGSRMMRYPNGSETIDQIESIIIKELKDSIDTRRAVITTLVPEIDKDSKEPPCMTQLQILQTNKKMHFLVTFRSHDIFKAAIANAFGLRTLQKKIADRTGMELGCLSITSQSAHIYEAEWNDAKKLVSCAIWEREPKGEFDPTVSGDPRGLFVISNKDGKISAYFKTPSGDDLLNISGKNAKEVFSKIGQLDLLSKPEHYLDIGAELQKAEIALSLNVPYIQDKPLPLEKIGLDNKNLEEESSICIEC
jgi:thymidylate synthase